MPLIPPIGDAYIDDIIKAVDPYDSTLNKTQGVKLRELIKLMRDRMEQQAAMAVAMQRTYTEIGNFDVSVNPSTYFDQPTTFIVNRNSGTDAIISFENYASLDDTGKVYQIKNMGLKPVVLVSASGALFDGETSITLSQYSAVTIMSVILTIEGTTVSKWAIMSSKGRSTDEVFKVLTLNINGLPENIPVAVNGTVWPGRKKSFPIGTVLQNLVITAAGYTIDPSSIPSVTLDEDKTLTFNATATGDDPILTIVVNGIDGPYEVAANNVIWPGNKNSFPVGTVLENLVVTVEDYIISPPLIDQVIMDSDKTLTFVGQNEGFSHIDIQWETEFGGGMETNVTRTGNSLFRIPESESNYNAWAGFELHDREVGSLKFEIHPGTMGILKTSEVVNGQNTFAYAVKAETSGQVYAICWLNHEDSEYVLLENFSYPITVAMEFTATEVIWYHSDSRTEWHRTNRKVFDYYIGTEVYTSVENIKQKGFTATVAPDILLLPGSTYLNLPSQQYIESPNNVYTAVSETRIMLAEELVGEGFIAIRYANTDYSGELFLGALDDVAGQSVGCFFYNGGLYWEIIDGVTELAVNMSEGMFAVLRKTATNILLQTTTDGISFTTVHDFGVLDYQYIRLYSASGSKYHYLQGIGLNNPNDITLLPGKTFMSLPNVYYSEDTDGFTQIPGTSGFIDWCYTLPSDGEVYIKYTGDSSVGPELILLNQRADETDNGQYLDMFFDNGNIIWSQYNGSESNEVAVIDAFYGYRRNGANVKLMKTLDGIVFTEIADFGDHSDRIYVSSYRGNNSGIKITYPQGIGLVSLPINYAFSSTVSWGDEFAYSGAPDDTKWGLDEGNGYYGWGNSEQQYYTDRLDNVVVADGTLSIIARAESYDGFNYTSAKLNTHKKRMFQYGRFVIRAKLPVTAGMWPAMFLFGEDHQFYNLESWPNCGEIDMMEFNGNSPDEIHNSIHSGYYNYGNGHPQYQKTSIGNPNEFNNYRFDWTPDYIRWFINDVETYQFINDGGDHSHWPFSDWFNLMISLSVGGNFVGPIDNGALPQKYEIEYVRYYELLGDYRTPQKSKPDTPVIVPTEGIKNQSDSLTINVISKPNNTTVKWFVGGGIAAEGDLILFPPETPLGVYQGYAVAVDNVTGVASLPVKIYLEVIGNP